MKSSTAPRRTAFPSLVGGLIVLGTLVSVGLAQDRTEPARGELKIEGTHIARLVLRRDDGHSEEWSNLSGSINLPVGTYGLGQLTLRGDYTCQPQGLTAMGPIKVTEDKPAILKAGGPLQQTIKVKRQGRTLVIDYHLQGIGGEEYTAPRRMDNRATFTAYRGDKTIAAGNFEYG